MTQIRRIPPISSRRSVRTALPPAARPPMSRDTGRAAAGRAGSFNSGKNVSELVLILKARPSYGHIGRMVHGAATV